MADAGPPNELNLTPVLLAVEALPNSLAVAIAELLRREDTISPNSQSITPAGEVAPTLAFPRVGATHSTPADIAVKLVSVEILPANAARIGMELVNVGGSPVRLMLGAAASAKHGLWLSREGGTWNGLLGNALWTGSIFAICEAGETTVAVIEA